LIVGIALLEMVDSHGAVVGDFRRRVRSMVSFYDVKVLWFMSFVPLLALFTSWFVVVFLEREHFN
jgi:hypothetical protein